jgi:TRAP-type C4-dicarboxylate transport system permease small subunit
LSERAAVADRAGAPSAVDRAARWLFSSVPRVLIGVLMLLDVALNGANVVGRYFFGSPIFWAEEVMVHLTIWGVFIGIVAVAYQQEHLSMDLFASRLTGRAQRALQLLVVAALVVCCIFTARQSWTIVRMFADTGAVTNAAGIPKVIPHAALLIGFAMTAVAAVLGLRARLRSGTAMPPLGGLPL